jgi:hypothetical protein
MRYSAAAPVIPAAAGAVPTTVSDQDGATTVRLVHGGLPPEAVDSHAQGWAYFLGVLCDLWLAD